MPINGMLKIKLYNKIASQILTIIALIGAAATDAENSLIKLLCIAGEFVYNIAIISPLITYL